MDHAERQRLKQLANDSIIATFGQESNEARLAQALEKCVEELEEIATKCHTCSYCDDHGENGVEFNDESDSDYVHKEVPSELP